MPRKEAAEVENRQLMFFVTHLTLKSYQSECFLNQTEFSKPSFRDH